MTQAKNIRTLAATAAACLCLALAPSGLHAQATAIQLQDVAAALGLGGPYDPQGDLHCPGAVFTDLTGDLLPDLYLVRGDTASQTPQANRLLVGHGPAGFQEIVGAAGAGDLGNSAGALAADFDRDGLKDLFVINFQGTNTLYLRRGDGFADRTAATDPTPDDGPGDDQEGLAVGCDTGESPATGCSLDATLAAAAGDFDRDGWLDLYVGNHLCCGAEDGQRDVLYRSKGIDAMGNLTFEDITISAGIEVKASMRNGNSSTQAVIVADLNNDRWPDIYVTHKGMSPPGNGNRDRLFLNDGDHDGDGAWVGTFTEYFQSQPDPELGRITCEAMGLDVGDYDSDGDLDLHLTDISGEFCGGPPVRATHMDLYRNLLAEQGSFGLAIVDPNPVPAPGLGWGTSWGDFDNDGDEDLHVATNPQWQNFLYENLGGGAFSEVTAAAGALQFQSNRATIPADFDRDGRLDLLVASRGPVPLSLFQNQTAVTDGSRWLEIHLVGNPSGPGPFRSTPEAVGATIYVDTPGGATLRRDVLVGGITCGSTRDTVAHFGLGDAGRVDVRVLWPSGRTTVLSGVEPDRLLVIEEP